MIDGTGRHLHSTYLGTKGAHEGTYLINYLPILYPASEASIIRNATLMYLPTIYLFLYTDIPTRYLFLYSAVKPLFIEMLCLIYFIASHHENLTLLSSSIVSIWRGAINEGITAGATAAGSKPVATTPSSRRVLDRWQRAGHRAGDRS